MPLLGIKGEGANERLRTAVRNKNGQAEETAERGDPAVSGGCSAEI